MHRSQAIDDARGMIRGTVVDVCHGWLEQSVVRCTTRYSKLNPSIQAPEIDTMTLHAGYSEAGASWVADGGLR